MSNYPRTNPSSRSPQRQRMLTPKHISSRNRTPVAVSDKKHGPKRGFFGMLRILFLHIIGWPIVVLVLLVLLIEVGVIVLLIGERDYTNRIYPNISVRGLDLSNHTYETGNLALQKRYEPFLQHPLEIQYGSHSWYPSARNLGITLDFDTALNEALLIGHNDTRIENTRTVAAVWQDGVELPLQIHIDQQKMQHYLTDIASLIDTPSQNADVALQGEHIIITSAQHGLQTLVDDTMQDITIAMQSLEPHQTISLRTRSIAPVVNDEDISPVIAELTELLSEPIILTQTDGGCVGECTWEWSTAKLANWITLVRGTTPDGIPTVSIEIDQNGIRKSLVPIAESVRRDGTLPRVNWNNGDMRIYQEGLPGRGLDVALTQSLVNKALREGPRTIDLPMTNIPPPVTAANLSSLGIVGPVGTGASSFLNSEQYRITNIQAGSRRMHGILIPPGAEFSFNGNLGAVDARGGFVQGYAIVNNRTQLEWGGGLCQVSTTMYRAAFWAGLPIIERHEHKFRIPWYEELGEPPGFDAAIFTGADDVRFINDTGGWLLTQTWVDLNRLRLFITLYGPAINRKVEMSHRIIRSLPAPKEPVTVEDPKLPVGTYKQTDWAQPGLMTELYRVVWQGGNVLRRDTFPTKFEPWPDVFVRGTGGQ